MIRPRRFPLRPLLTIILFAMTVVAVTYHNTLPVNAKPQPGIGTGKLISISVLPEKVELVGSDDIHQLVVTGNYETGQRDLTRDVKITPADAKVAKVHPGGLVLPLANGKTEIVLEHDGQTLKVPVAVAGTQADQPINFANEIVPILTKLGCNTGACHGKADGQNGFKLSLLGFDAVADYEAIAYEARGRRVLLSAPESSLLLLKTTGQIGHGGGKRMEVGSPEYKLLVRWIGSAVPLGKETDAKITGITVQPASRILPRKSGQQLRVAARLSDGSSRDVTRRAEFVSNDPEVIDVSETGLVETLDRFGAGSVMVRFSGHVAVFSAAIPLENPPENLTPHKPHNFVDELVFAKHKQLGFPASALCSDGDFLRRASLDITGTLPTVEEAKQFIADKDPKKREKLVDELLKRPEYAAYFTLRWADILRVRGGGNDNEKTGMEGLNTRAVKFHAWIRESLDKNKPYDQFVREILTASGPTSGEGTQPPILWYLELKTAQGLVDDVGQAFLGTRIQCAQCHHHPFERWSQDDYWGLATFFAKAQWQTDLDKNGKRIKGSKPIRLSEAGRMGQKVGFNPDGKLTSPEGKEYVKPRALDTEPMELAKDKDPREALADWMARPDNPFFAKALVNRYWGYFFAHGIVDPVDDLRATNPPSNPELLDALAEDFIKHKFDLKHLVRTICTSKTYQLASKPNEHNKDDTRHYARSLPRRLPAEVLLDAVDRVTGTKTKFRVAGENKPVYLEIRAIERPHQRVSTYFLDVFGMSKRDSACECGRESATTLAQRALLLNNGEVSRKLSERAAKLMKDTRPLPQRIDEAYLAFFSRYPTDAERSTVEKYITDKSKDDRKKQEAYYDFVWALLNSKEFVFNH